MSAEKEIVELRETVQTLAQVIGELQVRVLALGVMMMAWSARFPWSPEGSEDIQQRARNSLPLTDKEKEEVLEHVRGLILLQPSPPG
jgi:hypothetical protein